MNNLLDNVKYFHVLKNRQNEIDLNYVPRRGMGFERGGCALKSPIHVRFLKIHLHPLKRTSVFTLLGIIIMANPYSEDTTRKFNSMELLVPRTGSIHHLCKLPQSLYMPGNIEHSINNLFLLRLVHTYRRYRNSARSSFNNASMVRMTLTGRMGLGPIWPDKWTEISEVTE